MNVTATQAAIECHGCPRGTFGDAKALKDISKCKPCALVDTLTLTRFPHLTIFPQPCRARNAQRGGGVDEGLERPYARTVMQVIIASIASTSEAACLPCSAGRPLLLSAYRILLSAARARKGFHRVTRGRLIVCRACPESTREIKIFFFFPRAQKYSKGTRLTRGGYPRVSLLRNPRAYTSPPPCTRARVPVYPVPRLMKYRVYKQARQNENETKES